MSRFSAVGDIFSLSWHRKSHIVEKGESTVNASRHRDMAAEPASAPPKRSRAQADERITRQDRDNYLVHQLYLRHEYDLALAAITHENSFTISVRAKIARARGEIEESLALFQRASALVPGDVRLMRQIGRSLYLLGRHRQALEVLEEAEALSADDWETWHNKGLCHSFLGRPGKAVECFQQANSIQRHDGTFLQLGRVLAAQGRVEDAAEVYAEALDFSPENAELLTAAGLLHLRAGEVGRAFEYLGAALARNPRDSKTILAAGSVMLDHDDVRPAMAKFRVAAAVDPDSPQLWSNVGMGFYAQGKLVAAAACLKRALYLAPFEWIVAFNAGLVHLAAGQYASAFHYLSASINLHPGHAPAYACLAVALGHLGDPDNAFQAYERALQADPADMATHLNYAVTLFRHGRRERAAARLVEYDRAFAAADAEARSEDPEVPRTAETLRKALAEAPKAEAEAAACNPKGASAADAGGEGSRPSSSVSVSSEDKV